MMIPQYIDKDKSPLYEEAQKQISEFVDSFENGSGWIALFMLFMIFGFDDKRRFDTVEEYISEKSE